MSTRGYVGLHKDGIDKGGYNHCDSYPEGLGNEVLTFLKGNNLENLEKLFNEIGNIENEDREDAWDWNNDCFNVKMQIRNDFLKDSLFCEYAYIINLTTNSLEYYEGFNKNPKASGRYASFTVYDDKKYYGVALKMVIALDELFEGKWFIDKNEKFQMKG